MSEIKKQRKSKKPSMKTERILIPVIRITNPFNTREFVNDSLIWSAKKTLNDYFPDAPFAAEQSLVVSVNGKIIPKDHFASTYLDKTDNLVICPVPTGGHGGGKQILELVALIAVVAVASVAGPALADALTVTSAAGVGAVTAGVMFAGSMLVQSIFAQSAKTEGSGNNNSTSYGIDGAKTTSTEGVPVPVSYGKFRTAGNIVDIYTENYGTTQILYMLINVGEGPISSITNIQLNGNDIETYSNVQTDIRLGLQNQSAIPWFDNILSPHSLGLSLSTTPTYYTTTAEVTGFRLDFTAPNGLFNVNTSDGSLQNQTVNLVIQYAPSGTNQWVDLSPINQITGTQPVCGVQNTGFTGTNVGNAEINAEGQMFVLNADTGLYEQVTPTTSWYKVTDSEWVKARNLLEFSPSSDNEPITDPSQIAFLDANFSADPLGAYIYTYGNESLSITANVQAAYRQSFTSGKLPLGKYDIRISRTSNKSVKSNIVDDIYISDVNEIIDQTLTYPNTVLLGLRIQLGSQINGIPNVTFMNNGILVNVWGIPGTFATQEQWFLSATNNPAWVVWDILTNTRYGAGVSPSRLDFESFNNWAQYCVQEGLTWNGPFDAASNIWDACQLVLRVGHSQLVTIGTIYSIVTEAPSTPVMMFSVANMIKDTYTETWLSTNDRANDITVNYFDKTDFYKQKSVRVYDPVALSAGAPDRTSNITLYGCDNVTTAYKEAQFMMNLNRHILKTVQFSAPMEAVACTVGDLIYVQHDMPNYAQAGRFQDDNTNSVLQLDRPVTMSYGTQYMLLALHSSQLQYTGRVTNIAGNSIFLTEFDGLKTVNRLVVNGVDTRVNGTFAAGGLSYGVTVDIPTGIAINATYELYATDIVEEINIVNTATPQTPTVTVESVITQSPMLQTPQLYDQWMFGDVNKVKQIFRVTGIKSTADYRRDITALQYDARVYDFSVYGTQQQPPLLESQTALITPVQSLQGFEESYVGPTGIVSNVTASWDTPINGVYQGADIYTQYNGGATTLYGSVSGVTSVSVPAKKGDTVVITVVSYDAFSRRSSIGSAPTCTVTVVGELSGVVGVGGVTGLQCIWSGADCKVSWRYNSLTHSYEFGSEPDIVGADAGSLDPHFMDYQVQVYDSTGAVLRRTEYVTSPNYTYSYAHNYADGLTREIRIVVAMRTKANQVGAPSTIDCYNPPPGITGTAVSPSFNAATLTYTTTSDPDFAGVQVWMSRNQSDISGDISSAAMTPFLVFDGNNSSIGLSNLMFDSEYFYRVAGYDVLGKVGLVPTDVLNFKTTYMDVGAIANGVLDTTKLSQDLQSTISLISAPSTTVGSVAAQIAASSAAQTAALQAEAVARGTAITNLTNSTNTAISGLSTSINTLTAETNSNTAAITNNLNAQSTINNATAAQFTALTASVASNTSAISNNASAQATINSATAATLSSLTTTVNSNTASITSNATTAANATSALASTVNTLSSTVGNQTTSIQQLQTVTNGLSAEYTVKIDTNGYISGFGLANTSDGATPTSEFLVRADSFAVVMPSHPAATPFAIGNVGGVAKVIINSALIGDAAINSAMIGNAQVNTLSIAGNSVTVPNGAVSNGNAPTVSISTTQTGSIFVSSSVNIIGNAGGSEAPCSAYIVLKQYDPTGSTLLNVWNGQTVEVTLSGGHDGSLAPAISQTGVSAGIYTATIVITPSQSWMAVGACSIFALGTMR